MVENLIVLLVMVALFIGAAWGALWIINNFFPPPWHTVAKVIVGLILLIILLLVVNAYFAGDGKTFTVPGFRKTNLLTVLAPIV